MPNVNSESPDWLLQMENILEELNEGVVIVDTQLRVVFANEALLRLGQYELAEIQGRTPDAIFPPEDIPFIMRQHESGHHYRHNRNEFHLPGKNGEKIPVIFSGRMIQGSDGREYTIVIVTDISAQKRIEQQLRDSNALLEKRQSEMEAELALAARVQRSLTPHSLAWNGIVVEAYYSPAHTIGGDFGIVLPQEEEFLNLVMCDVSGHGVGSALMANRIYSEALHALQRSIAPGTLLKRLHDFVQDRIAVDGFYFTMAAARFSQDGRHLSFAAGGHPPGILVSDGSARLLNSQSGILGCISETAPSELADQIELSPGDRLILYTDGLVEVFNSLDDMLGVEGLKTLVLEWSQRPIDEFKQAILEGVATWAHGPLADDVSLVIVEIR
jgi:PAS domain S-box-containing protein